ncbi:MAG: hypothetical protein WD360_03725 [Nitriliruptoraceae bacterium]
MAARKTWISVLFVGVLLFACAETPVPSERTPVIALPIAACDHSDERPDIDGSRWANVAPVIQGDGVVRSIKAVVDADIGDVLIRVETLDGRAPQIFIDADGDRLSGAWTYQTHVSASAWNLHIDEAGQLWRHDGRPDQWQWSKEAPPSTFWWNVYDDGVDICLPASLLQKYAGNAESLAIAAVRDEVWLPAAFLQGIPVVPRAIEIRPVALQLPTRLAFAYQWAPWSIGDCVAAADPIACAAEHYGVFDHVVFGAGLEDDTHPSHEQTVALIAQLQARRPDGEIWGYVSLLRHQGEWHDTAEIARRAQAWRALGATGIFLDEYDVCEAGWRTCRRDQNDQEIIINRGRQVDAVTSIHALGLAVFANAHSLHGALGDMRGIQTPLGDGAGARPADMYLLENPTVWDSRWWTGLDRLAAIARFHDAPGYAAATGVRLAVVDTAGGPASTAPPALIAASWWRALLAGADAHGFSNAVYSATDELAHDIAVVDVPAGVDERLFAALYYSSSIELKDGGATAYRMIENCHGDPVGRIEVTVASDGAVQGGFVIASDELDCVNNSAAVTPTAR